MAINRGLDEVGEGFANGPNSPCWAGGNAAAGEGLADSACQEHRPLPRLTATVCAIRLWS